jgi:hypothetical protein
MWKKGKKKKRNEKNNYDNKLLFVSPRPKQVLAEFFYSVQQFRR